MAELPEVEIARRDLDKDVSGRKIKSVEVPGPYSMLSGVPSKKALGPKLEGHKIVSVSRRGLWLLFDLGDDLILAMDLGHGAYIRRHANKDAVEPDTVLIIQLTQTGQIRLIAPKDSEPSVVLLSSDEIEDKIPLGTGFDPAAQPIPWTDFGRLLRARGKEKLLHLLADESFIIGIGPIYADEILHSALLRYDRTAESLTIQEIRRLYRAVVETVHAAIKHRGTTLPDVDYVDVFGKPGNYGQYIEVYGRVGQRGKSGRGDVRKLRVNARAHYFCDYQV